MGNRLSAGAQEGGKQPGKSFPPAQSIRNRGLSRRVGQAPGEECLSSKAQPGQQSVPPSETPLKLGKRLAKGKLESSSTYPGRGGFLPAFHRTEVQQQSFCMILSLDTKI